MEENVKIITGSGVELEAVLMDSIQQGVVTVLLSGSVNQLEFFKKGDRATVRQLQVETPVVVDRITPPSTLLLKVVGMHGTATAPGGTGGMYGGDERRSYLRIEDSIPFEVRRVSRGEQSEGLGMLLQADDPSFYLQESFGFSSGLRNNQAEFSGDLRTLLLNLNAKVDFLIKYTLMKEEKGFHIPKVKKINLSGTGINYESPAPYQEGETVEILMILPQMPPRTIITNGCIVRCVKANMTPPIYNIAINFTTIDNNDREAIIQYTVQKQIREIRKMKNR